MQKRLATLAALIGAATTLLALTAGPASAASTASPWWQLLTGARPSLLPAGGQGRLTLSLVNVGDAPLQASKAKPLVIEEDLPEGVSATKVLATAGVQDKFGPLECALDTATHLTCGFEGALPSYEALEVEVFVDVTGPAGEPGQVTVSGANAPPKKATQQIGIGSGPTPFGIERFAAEIEEEGGGPDTGAGSHPFQMTSTVQLNAGPTTGIRGGLRVEQPQIRDLRVTLPAGFLGNATAVPTCDLNDFFTRKSEIANNCPDASAVGVINLAFHDSGTLGYLHAALPVFNLTPGHGEPARFGFTVVGNPIVMDFSVDPETGYRLIASFHNTTQVVNLLSGTLVVWGSPADPRHDSSRGWGCAFKVFEVSPCQRPPSLSEKAFLRMPVACSGPFDIEAQAEPWNVPAGSLFDTALVEEPGMGRCNQVPFGPTVTAGPSTKLAANPSGLDYTLTMPNAGLLKSEAIAEGQAKKVEVTLPEGMTLNPSQAEGLATCSPAQYAAERFNSIPGAGCLNASKIGEVKVRTPLLAEEARGSVYVATPYDNPFNSLIALYIVARIPERGILVKQAGVVTTDPSTGQITTTFDELPQLPFSSFEFHFRPGARAPLATPPSCGNYDILTRFVPWSAADPDNPSPAEVVTRTSPFTIERGVDGGICPAGGLPPFHPGLIAGTRNNAAGSFSPFDLRLTRTDGEQEITHFSIKLPPGVVGKLAGIPSCPDAAIAAAKARSGPHGGAEELESPSCPQASEIGHTLAGSGVGSVLVYVPGKVYLAGPYHGAPISIVAITAAKAGPFDLGTVVVREALKINPETAEVFIDSVGSDPIPHIIRGIPVHLRDIRAYVDRPEFVLNPTDCTATSTASTLLGSGLDFVSEADDNPITVTSRFQAADCAALAFRPRLSMKLTGGTRRGSFPKFSAHLAMNGIGESAIQSAEVVLPKSEFIANAHFVTICTRVQFAEGAGNGANCPSGSIYGHAKASTPILGEPLEGPVFLRSNGGERNLPDLVVVLHNAQVDFDLVGFVDSVKGRLRNRFEAAPDAPVSSFDIELEGGSKGLFENSTNLCAKKHFAMAAFSGQNGKAYDAEPVLSVKCPKKHKRHAKRHHKRHSGS